MKPPVFNSCWDEETKTVYRHDMQEIWEPSIAPQIWNQYHGQLALYLGLVPSGKALRVLDVGCAQATLALLLAEQGHRVWAMDVRQNFLDYAASRHERGEIHFVRANALELSWAERFDVIFCNQLVEHLVYPARLVERLRDWLLPAGRLVLTTPNGIYAKNALPSFTSIGDPALHELRQFSADGDGHFFAYRPQELLEIVREAGFRSVKLRFFESPWISGHMKVRHAHAMLPFPILSRLDKMTLGIPGLGKRLAHQLLVVAER